MILMIYQSTKIRLARIFLLLIASVMLPTFAVGEEFAGILVNASGEATAKPDTLEIDVRAAGAAELTGDALVKFRDAVTRLREALAKLDIKNVKIEEQGLGVIAQPANAQALAAAGNANQPLKGGINIQKSLRLTVTGIDQLPENDVVAAVAKLIDTAMDAGGTTGKASNPMLEMMGRAVGSSAVKFVVSDASAARKKAYEQAFQEAKTRAENLASLAGVKLGPVLAIKESESRPADTTSMQERMISAIYGSGTETTSPDARLTSDELVELPVRITLEVRFAIQ